MSDWSRDLRLLHVITRLRSFVKKSCVLRKHKLYLVGTFIDEYHGKSESIGSTIFAAVSVNLRAAQIKKIEIQRLTVITKTDVAFYTMYFCLVKYVTS